MRGRQVIRVAQVAQVAHALLCSFLSVGLPFRRATPALEKVGQDGSDALFHRLLDERLPLRTWVRFQPGQLRIALVVRLTLCEPGKDAQLGQEQDHELHEGGAMLDLVRTEAIQGLAHGPLPLARQGRVHRARSDDLEVEGKKALVGVEAVVLELDEDLLDVLGGEFAVRGEGAHGTDTLGQSGRDASWEAGAFVGCRVPVRRGSFGPLGEGEVAGRVA